MYIIPRSIIQQGILSIDVKKKLKACTKTYSCSMKMCSYSSNKALYPVEYNMASLHILGKVCFSNQYKLPS
jgi:hypothetical protein